MFISTDHARGTTKTRKRFAAIIMAHTTRCSLNMCLGAQNNVQIEMFDWGTNGNGSYRSHHVSLTLKPTNIRDENLSSARGEEVMPIIGILLEN